MATRMRMMKRKKHQLRANNSKRKLVGKWKKRNKKEQQVKNLFFINIIRGL